MLEGIKGKEAGVGSDVGVGSGSDVGCGDGGSLENMRVDVEVG